VRADLLDADGITAPPRRNGELLFEAPWQSRVFGLCAAIVETCFDGDREPFRRQLIAAIAAEPDRPYWDSWTIALQQLVLEVGLLDELSIERHIGLPKNRNKISPER
jgi:nitrile hydratase beta subunit-like protein